MSQGAGHDLIQHGTWAPNTEPAQFSSPPWVLRPDRHACPAQNSAIESWVRIVQSHSMKTSPLALFHSRCFRLGCAAAAVAVVVAALLCAHAGSQSGSTGNDGQPVIRGGSRPAPSYGTGAPAPAQHGQAEKNPDYPVAGVIGGKAGFWVTGQGGLLPDHVLYSDSTGALGIVNLRGPIETEGHPFFTSIREERPRLRLLPSAGQRHEHFRCYP